MNLIKRDDVGIVPYDGCLFVGVLSSDKRDDVGIVPYKDCLFIGALSSSATFIGYYIVGCDAHKSTARKQFHLTIKQFIQPNKPPSAKNPKRRGKTTAPFRHRGLTP